MSPGHEESTVENISGSQGALKHDFSQRELVNPTKFDGPRSRSKRFLLKKVFKCVLFGKCPGRKHHRHQLQPPDLVGRRGFMDYGF